MHVAQSHFHDIVPAHALGIPSVWINRLGERGEPAPTRELPDLSDLADVLDELVARLRRRSAALTDRPPHVPLGDEAPRRPRTIPRCRR